MKPKRNKDGTYSYNGWVIEGVGGFCTVRHYWATKDEKSVWAFRLRELPVMCDTLDAGGTVHGIYLKPLYI